MATSSRARSPLLLAVLVGSVIGWLLIAIQQYVWDGGTGGRLPYLPNAWYEGYEAVYVRFGAPHGLSAYYFWGRFTPLLYVAVILGVSALPRGARRVSRASRRVLLVGGIVGLIGDALAYWGGTDKLSEFSGIGFSLVEAPALLVTLVAMVVYGIGLAREGIKPSLVAWSLIAGGTLALPVSFFALSYVPHGILLVILAALALALIALCVAGGPRTST